MVKIKILLENYSVSEKFETKHGLSIFIEHSGKNILLDVGPDAKFANNAAKMNVDLKKVDYLFLSHNHDDHTGGINDFMKINSTASIYLMDNIDNEYYSKRMFFKTPIGLKLNKEYRSRVTQLAGDMNIDKKIFFLKNTVSRYQKPTLNKKLFKKENGRVVHDTFDHEGILVLDDAKELVIFNSCSHNGILNTIQTIKSKLPNRKIRSYVGGLHLFNPVTSAGETTEYMDDLSGELKELPVIIYTGHCTGRPAMNYMKEKLNDQLREIRTGMELSV